MARDQTRREWLKSAAAAGTLGTAALAGCTGNGDGNGNGNGNGNAGGGGTVKIGVMQPLTGDVQYYGQQSLWGFLSGLAYKHDQDPLDVSSAGTQTIEAGDVTYELIIENSEFSPDQAQTVATSSSRTRRSTSCSGPPPPTPPGGSSRPSSCRRTSPSWPDRPPRPT